MIEASSGSTAISEAYFARKLGLDFVAVMAASTAKEKISLIENLGGNCILVDKANQVLPRHFFVYPRSNKRANALQLTAPTWEGVCRS